MITDVFEVVHSDICGPLEVLLMGGNKYFVTFVDEYSRMLWLYSIRTKDEALSMFQSLNLCLKNKLKNLLGY
jgi:hypothetical protein